MKERTEQISNNKGLSKGSEQKLDDVHSNMSADGNTINKGRMFAKTRFWFHHSLAVVSVISL